MNLKIALKLQPTFEEISVEIQSGTTIEELAKRYQQELPYRILAAKRNNVVVPLSTGIESFCKIVFLDMRDPSANQIYQRSLIFIYLKAIKDILKTDKVLVANSLNKGVYTEIRTAKPITALQLKSVEKRMESLVKEDIPIKLETVSGEKLPMYTMDGYQDFFYSFMVPSTGYIEYFQLRKYRRGVLLLFPEPKVPNCMPEYRDDVKLYQAFGEATRWLKLMRVQYVADLNEKVKDGSYKQLIQVSEALHEKRIVEIANMITKQKKRIVLIAGPSSSGKTTFAQRLCTQLRVNGLDPLYMGTDDYFVNRKDAPLDEMGEPNFEDLISVDVDLFNSNMNALLSGKTVDMPIFDFIKGEKVFGKRVTKIKSDQLIVIEGIHGLNQKLTSQISVNEKFKIYISPLTQLNIDEHNRISTTDARLLRRIVRDSQFRNYTAQHTIKLWTKVRAGEDKNIFPFNGEADVVFNSVHLYEISVLKKYAEPLLSKIEPTEEVFSEAFRLLKFLRYFETIEDDTMIANNSILREFIGGSVFVD